ncbi:MAG: InlB B-repeat-containing protein [Coriobacteriales bacterium]|jgi:uncharacterized repeat protein (TIGR02543 family)|nr:InlB B-repeat-containing protein [Coriobacteriales bacterium]
MKTSNRKRVLAMFLAVNLLFSIFLVRAFGEDSSTETENPVVAEEQATSPDTPPPETQEGQENEAVTPNTETPAGELSTENGATDDQTTGVTPENPGSDTESTMTEPKTNEVLNAATTVIAEQQGSPESQVKNNPKTVCVCLEERLCVHDVYVCCNVCPDCLSAAAEASKIELLEEAPDKKVATFKELQNAITAAPAGTTYVIEITANIGFDGYINIKDGKQIVLMSNGNYTLTTLQDAYRHFKVSSELTLLPGVTLTNRNTTEYGGGIEVNTGGILNIKGGSIVGNVNSSSGGGVYCDGGTVNLYSGTVDGNTINKTGSGGGVHVRSGTFNMYGGSVSNNHSFGSTSSGGGVGVNKSGTFILYGGVINGNISDHTAQGGGGVFVLGDGKFEMHGGTISNNVATASSGGGVMVGKSNFTITGGTISGNSAISGGGLFYSSTVANISNVTITGNTASDAGGGVFANAATLNMTDVSITGNTAATDGGGVFYLANASNGQQAFTMTGGLIDNNTAQTGGGVYLNYASNLYLNSATVSNNKANGANGGGGIYVSSTLNINDSKVIGNTAATSHGGGMYVSSSGLLNMTSGEVTDNVAILDGGGIYTEKYNLLTISNTVVFTRNSAQAAYDYGIANRGAGAWSRINWAGDNSIPGTHLLNNYDVQYTEGSPLLILTVTFDENYALGNTYQKTVLSSVGTVGEADMPANPERDGYDFVEWNTASDGSGSTFVATTPVTASITVYAIWLAKPVPPVYYTVNFYDWDGTLIETEQIISGGAAIAPADPERTGYTFVDWDKDFSNITEDEDIYALYRFIVVEIETPDPDPKPDPDPDPSLNIGPVIPGEPIVVTTTQTPLGRGPALVAGFPQTGDNGMLVLFLMLAGVVITVLGLILDPRNHEKLHLNGHHEFAIHHGRF